MKETISTSDYFPLLLSLQPCRQFQSQETLDSLVFHLLALFWNIHTSTVLFTCSLFLHNNHHPFLYQFRRWRQNKLCALGDSSLPIVYLTLSHRSLRCCSLSSFQHAYRAPEMIQVCPAHLDRIKEKKEKRKVPRGVCTKTQCSLVSALSGCVGHGAEHSTMQGK